MSSFDSIRPLSVGAIHESPLRTSLNREHSLFVGANGRSPATRLTFLVDLSSAATYDIFEYGEMGQLLWRVKDDTRELLSASIPSFPRRVQASVARPATSPRAASF